MLAPSYANKYKLEYGAEEESFIMLGRLMRNFNHLISRLLVNM